MLTLPQATIHMGVRNTVARVKERFTWKGVYKDVEAIVSYFIIQKAQLISAFYIGVYM